MDRVEIADYVRWMASPQTRRVTSWRWVAGILLASVPVVAGCAHQGGNGFTANQQHFLNDVRGTGVPSSLISDQNAVKVGSTVCSTLAKGVTFPQLVQGFQTTFGNTHRAAQADVMATDAVEDLCPKYKSEVPR